MVLLDPGKIYLKDIYDMNPFQSNIVTFEMNGEEIYKTMNFLQTGEKKFYAISGMKIYFKKVNETFIVDKINLSDDKEIDRKKNYTIATTNCKSNFCISEFKVYHLNL